MTHSSYSLKKSGSIFSLHKELLKTEIDYDEADGNKYFDKKNECLDDVNQGVLVTAFSYDR